MVIKSFGWLISQIEFRKQCHKAFGHADLQWSARVPNLGHHTFWLQLWTPELIFALYCITITLKRF